MLGAPLLRYASAESPLPATVDAWYLPPPPLGPVDSPWGPGSINVTYGSDGRVVGKRLNPHVQDPESAAVNTATEPAEEARDASSSMQSTRLYVGQGNGGTLGLILTDGDVTGGFAVPDYGNRNWAAARRRDETPFAKPFGTEVWPIRHVHKIDSRRFRVVLPGGLPMPGVHWYELVIEDVDEGALFFRATRQSDPAAVDYSGTAMFVATSVPSSR